MAWRFAENILRGEIDNTRRGRVKGTFWIAGISIPFHLVLRGDCAPDLAGCKVGFKNPNPVPMDWSSRPEFVQTGWVGEVTSARRFKVPDMPIEEFVRMKNGPFHWANTLTLEWQSKTDGEICLHMHDFKLTVSMPEWTFTQAEYEASREQSGREFTEWLKNGDEWDDYWASAFDGLDEYGNVIEGEEWKRADEDSEPPEDGSQLPF